MKMAVSDCRDQVATLSVFACAAGRAACACVRNACVRGSHDRTAVGAVPHSTIGVVLSVYCATGRGFELETSHHRAAELGAQFR